MTHFCLKKYTLTLQYKQQRHIIKLPQGQTQQLLRWKCQKGINTRTLKFKCLLYLRQLQMELITFSLTHNDQKNYWNFNFPQVEKKRDRWLHNNTIGRQVTLLQLVFFSKNAHSSFLSQQVLRHGYLRNVSRKP